MTVTPLSTHRAEHMGHSYFFCSAKCKAKFDANPMQYIGTPAAAPSQPFAEQPVAAGTIYTCQSESVV